ncbi:hypothetical protein SAMN05428949_7085 [Chitinophaga sp. YR627]|uniref:DUF6934 family protein n=1 Tax=Chitinophaga sp. YR627 TaxID=1881041 RepID=UPI0008E8FDCF|nr:hypothetical protein [Chitinophaga sp. YR627]SFO98998.1 hypothetical protein SAMN05428949_7085 [Chitinophaga sp. YR627]
MIKLDFQQTFPPTWLEKDYSKMTFESPQEDGSIETMVVKIDRHPAFNSPNVYNMGFGPPDMKGGFRDNVKLKHKDLGKVLSTVLFHGNNFLQENSSLVLGIDGSDDVRAMLYHLITKVNREYLSEFFTVFGVDWFIRVLRDGRLEIDENGRLISNPKPEIFDYQRSRHDLYRYYIFRLK